MALTMSRLSGSITGGPLMQIRRKELRPPHDFIVFYSHVTVQFTFLGGYVLMPQGDNSQSVGDGCSVRPVLNAVSLGDKLYW